MASNVAGSQRPLGEGTPESQGGSGAQGFGGLAQTFGIGSNFQAQGPNAGAYNQQIDNANAQQQQYNGLANSAQGRPGAQINNAFQGQSQGQMADAQGRLQQAYGTAGQVQPVAQNQFQKSLDQSLASNLALANSQRAGSVGAAGAGRMAQQQNATMAQGATNDAMINRANEQMQQAGLQSGIAGQEGQLGLGQYSLEQQDAERQAAMDQQQQAQNDAYGLGLYGLANQSSGQGLQALNSYTAGNLGAQNINAGVSMANAKEGDKVLGSITSALGQGAGLLSDPKLKKGMRDASKVNGDNLVDSFLSHVDPKVYQYKRGMDEPTKSPTGGHYLGVSADQVAKTPVLGQQLVKKTARGKALDVGPSISATLAGLGRLHSRVARLERGGR